MPIVVELVTLPAEPLAGDTVRWQASIVNTGAEPVRVPERSVTELQVDAFRMDPNVGYGRGYGGVSTQAGSIEWRTIAAGERVVVEGVACERCDSGTWSVAVVAPRWVVTEMAADQVLPELPAGGTFTVTSRVQPVTDGLGATARARYAGDAIVVDVKLKNTSGEAMWVPQTGWWHTSCGWTYSLGDGSGGGGGSVGGVDNWTPLREDRAVVLPPGGIARFSQRCEADLPPAKSATVTLTMRPNGEIDPIGATDALRAFSGTLEITAPVTLRGQ
jgi:hypothetical protein